MFKRKSKYQNRWVKPEPAAPAKLDRDWGKMRLAFIAVCFGIVWAGLWFRAWDLQVVRGPELSEKVSHQQKGSELITGFRGSIYDRNGQTLARSVEVRSVYVRPYEVEDVQDTGRALAEILGMQRAKVMAALNSDKTFVWLRRKVDDRTASRIQEAKLKGVDLATEFERVYPFKQLAGQLLGFVNIDDVGIEGLEKVFDNELSAQSTRVEVLRDAAGRKLYYAGTDDRSDLRGNDIHLTIDTQIQYFTEEALAKAVEQQQAKWGGCLVIDIPTGEILSWAEYPFFNPNAYRTYSSPSAWRSRLATDALEHGSTIKPLLVAAALTENRIKPDSRYFCENGIWRTKRFTIRDTSNRGWLSVEEILRYSSNIGAAKIGMEMGAPLYHEYLMKMGFGQRSGLPVLGESEGILRDARQWAEVDLATASFGQSFSANALQMAEAYLILASNGVKRPLKLVRGFDEEQPDEQVFSEEAADTVLQMLYGVVEEDGSGKRARIPGISVGGKTGTAQKASAGGYGAGRVSSFIGIAPLDAPRYLVVVLVDEPQKSTYGGIVAAPVFRHVVSRSMAYKGDLPDPSALLAEAEENGEAVIEETEPQTESSEKMRAAENSGLEDEDKAAETDASNFLTRRPTCVSISIADSANEAPMLVPNVVGSSVRSAMEAFMRLGITPTIKGHGFTVVRQEPAPGRKLTGGSDIECTLWISEQDI
ncbi:MAG: PASTA domain-containing protein [Desulfovibrionaceae bacterium]|nr:PASTA domain-containing protein [Desulfovibrionaceae bacterium]